MNFPSMNGDVSVIPEKLKLVIVFFTPALQRDETKLNKLLFYSDLYTFCINYCIYKYFFFHRLLHTILLRTHASTLYASLHCMEDCFTADSLIRHQSMKINRIFISVNLFRNYVLVISMLSLPACRLSPQIILMN